MNYYAILCGLWPMWTRYLSHFCRQFPPNYTFPWLGRAESLIFTPFAIIPVGREFVRGQPLFFTETNMAGFNDREKAEEAKYAHDEALKFRIEARRNKLLGLWAAGLLGKTEEADVNAYVGEVVASDFEEAGDEDVYRKVSGDFKAAGVSVAEEDLREKMRELYAKADAQVKESL